MDSIFLALSSVAQSCYSLWPHGPQHARPPCPSPIPGAHSNSCPSCWWCHPTISSSSIPFSSCLQSFPASGSFLISQFLASGGQSTGVSAPASVLPRNIQDWFPLGWTGWISLQSKGLSTHVNPWLIHVNVGQKQLQYCKVISLQLINGKKKSESSPTLQFKSINSSALSFLHSPTLTSIHDHWKNHSFD